MNADVAKGFDLGPQKIHSLLAPQEASISDQTAKGNLSSVPHQQRLERVPIKQSSLNAEDKRVNFENLDINTPRELLRNQ